MKKLLSILLLFAMVAVFAGCYSEPFTYEFRQPRSNVEKVEICAYDHKEGTKEVLVQLDEETADALFADLQALPCVEGFTIDAPNSYGAVVIFITYLDGEEEMIGVYNIGWRDADGKLHTSNMNFDIPDMRALIAKYVDAEILAEFNGF